MTLQITMAARTKLRPSPLQPRQHFDDSYLDELGESLRSDVGFINALVVRAIEYRWQGKEITIGMLFEQRCVRGEWGHVKHDEIPWDAVAGKGAKVLLTEEDCAKARTLMPDYEIIAGECRWRASQERLHPSHVGETMPAIAELPIVVREMDDVLVLETMLAENMQRGDLTELEECDAFHRAMAQTRSDGSPVYATMVQLADKIGVKEEVVRKRLSLRKLPKSARKLMLIGELSYSVARVACECPEPIVEGVIACALDPVRHEVWLPGIGYPGEPLSAEQTKLLIGERFVRKLQSAPFDLADEKLLPVRTNDSGERMEGGACEGCPWNSATGTETPERGKRGRPRGEAKTCLNPACFAKKVECHTSAAIAKAQADGHEVLTGKEAEKLLRGSPAGTLSYAFVDLDETIAPDDLAKGASGKTPKWKDVVFGEAEEKVVVARDAEGAVVEKVKGAVAVPITVVVSERGHVHRVVERKVAVAAAAKTKSAVKLSLSAGRASSLQDDDARERRQAEQAKTRLHNAITFAVVEEVVTRSRTMDFSDVNFATEFWGWMVGVATWHGGSDTANFVTKRRGLDGSDQYAAIEKESKKLTALDERRALALELLIGRQVRGSGIEEKGFRALCKLLEVDVAAIEKRVKAEAKPGKKDKGTGGGGDKEKANGVKLKSGQQQTKAAPAELKFWAWELLGDAERKKVCASYRLEDDATLALYEYGFDAKHKVKDRRPLPTKVDSEPISPENFVYFAKLDEMKKAGEKISPTKVQSKFKLPGLRSAGLLIAMWEKVRSAQTSSPAKDAASSAKPDQSKAAKPAKRKRRGLSPEVRSKLEGGAESPLGEREEACRGGGKR